MKPSRDTSTSTRPPTALSSTRNASARCVAVVFIPASPSLRSADPPLPLSVPPQVEALHTFDCLRANKATMAHGLEVRVPFLDKSVMDTVMSIDPEFKLRKAGAETQFLEKWLLRAAFDQPEVRVSRRTPLAGSTVSPDGNRLVARRLGFPRRSCGVRRSSSPTE